MRISMHLASFPFFGKLNIMKINPPGWTIFLAGNWNRFILSPQWSAKNIYDLDELKVEFALNLSLPPRFSSPDVAMVPSSNSVVFMPLQFDDVCLQKAEQFAHNLIDKLPYTPMNAFGINFGFIEENPDADLMSIFDSSDRTKLVEFGCEVDEASIKRKIKYGENIINLTVKKAEEGIVFNFNFHYEVRDASHANEQLKGQVLINKNLAYKMLAEIYNIYVQE
jgi:hypothetical protein